MQVAGTMMNLIWVKSKTFCIMKKYLIIAFAALFAFAACNKENNLETPSPKDQVVLTFTSEKPFLIDAETKTAWNPATSSIVWTSGDQIRVGYKLDGEWMGKTAAGAPKFYASKEVSIDSQDAGLGTFEVPVDDNTFADPQTVGSYVFYGISPKVSGTDFVSSESVASLSLPASQVPEANSFDKTADFMIGKSEAIALSGLPSDPIEISWDRVVAQADITFSNLDFDGTEVVSSIKLSFNDEALVAGNFTVNVETGVVSGGSESEITLDGSKLVAGSNSVEAWCCLLPVTFTALDVEIKTDKATYQRSITGISKTFKKNARNTLTVNMATAQRTENAPLAYELYSGTLTEGVYIIYDATDGHAMKAEISSNRFSYSAVTPENGAISTNEESILWYIAPSGTDGYFTIYNNAVGKYAAATGSNNQGQLLADGTDDKSLWSVDGSYDFINKARADASSDNKYLRSNGEYGFACYKNSTGHTLQLYKIDSREPLAAPASVSAVLDGTVSNTINVTFSTVSGAASYVITATPAAGGDAIVKDGVNASPAAIEGLAYDTEYAISVYAVPASNDADHKKSSATAASSTVTTGAKPAAPEGYELITSTDDVTTGLYIIAAKVSNKYYAMPNAFSENRPSGVELSITDGVVTTADAEDYIVSITKDVSTYTIQGDNNKYLGWSSSTNFNYSGNNTTWTVASGTNGTFRLTNIGSTGTSTTRVIAYTGSVFGPYAASNVTATSTNYYDVELFKFNGVVKTNPTTTVTPSSPINLEVSETQQLNVETNSDGAVSYESSDEDVATVTSAGLIEAIAAGTATITVTTAATDSYNEGTTTITVNVTNGPSSIAEVIAAASGASVKTSGVVAQVNLKGFIITDGSDNIAVYQNSTPSVVVGQSVEVIGTRGAYNNVPQISSPSIVAGVTGQTVTRTTLSTITSANATGITTNQYVSLTGALTSSSGYYNVSIDGSTTKGSLYQVSASTSFTGGTLSSLVGKDVTVTGYVTGSNDNYLYIAPVDIVEYVDPNAPQFEVTPTSKTWAYDETDEVEFEVTAVNGMFDYSPKSLSWASVTLDGNTIKVTPNDENDSDDTDNTATITVTFTPTYPGYSVSPIEISLTQEHDTSGDAPIVYTKITSTTNLTDGTYLIVYEDGTLAMNGGLSTLDAVNNTISVSISSNTIAQSAAMDAASFTYNASAKTLRSASGYYIGQTSNANGLASNINTQYQNTISFNSDGTANIVSGGAYLRYNSDSNQARFRYYKSSSYTGQKAICLYKRSN